MVYPDQKVLRKQYEKLYAFREIIANELVLRISGIVRHLHSPPSVISRVKEFDSYYKKYVRFLKRGDNFPFINDIIGIRIICPFLNDLSDVVKLIKANFDITQEEMKGEDLSYNEFGYESIHLLIKIPEDIIEAAPSAGCLITEIQIRTILQDAWAEVEHELFYKAELNLYDEPMKRKLHGVNATLMIADLIFQEIRSHQRQLNGELGKRRGSFFKKIEDSIDARLFDEEKPKETQPFQHITNTFYESTDSYGSAGSFGADDSIDDLLLRALSAHNQRNFSEAITYYTQILELDPDDTIKSLIYNHRGMSFFARSHYQEAVEDFSKALALDPKSYKAAYYQGIVCAVLQRYSDAIDAFNHSLEINPYQCYCLYRRGQAYFHMEDYPQALADCEASLALESFDGAVKFKQLLLEKLKM